MYEIGSIIEGTVVDIKNFGVFIKLVDGKIAFLPISEIADKYIEDVSDYLKLNEKIKAKVIFISQAGKINLSIKQIDESLSKPQKNFQEDEKFSFCGSENLSFEEKLSKFLRESEERLHDLRKNIDAKRGIKRK